MSDLEKDIEDNLEEDIQEEIVEETIDLDEPEVSEESESTKPALTKDEEQAMKFGWKPKAEYEGNPDDWKTAKQFNDHARMITQIKTQEKDLENLKKYMHLNQKQSYEEALEQARAELEEAKELGDFEAYDQARIKHSKAENGLAEQATVDNAEIERTFIERNKDWYDPTDRAQMAEVYAIAEQVTLDYPNTTVMKAMEMVERRIFDAHPEYKRKNPVTDKQIVNSTTSAINKGAVATSGSNKSFNTLPVNLQREYEQLRRSLEKTMKMEYTKEEYIQGLKDTGAI